MKRKLVNWRISLKTGIRIAVIVAIVAGIVPAAKASLTSDQMQKLNQYAEATARYFTSPEANNLQVGFTHAFFGTGKFQVYKNGQWQEEAWNLTRGYGSHVNINEVTLRFVALATAYKMDWLDYLPAEERYEASWGQILTGLQTLRYLQTSGDPQQYKDGHFHRNYLTTIARDGQYDLDRYVEEIVCPEGEDIQSSDDNALPFMNLLVLEGLASDPDVSIPNEAAIVQLCQLIRSDINLRGFVFANRIAHAIVGGSLSATKWDRLSAEGAIILEALLLSDQIGKDEFELIYDKLFNYPVGWNSFDSGVIPIDKPSYHAAMFIHGLRAIHGVPVTEVESAGLNYFNTSTKPVFEAHVDYAGNYSYQALGTQVMSQSLYGTPLFEMNGHQVQFPGNEDNSCPVPGVSLSRATGPHAWFVPLQRVGQLSQDQIDQLFGWMASYEADFFHTDSDSDLGWEAAIPWTHNDQTYGWEASDGSWKYTDWGRPFEALNGAYILLSIFDALNQDAPLASYSPYAEESKRIAYHLDNGVWPTPAPTAAIFRSTYTGDVLADGSFYGQNFLAGAADVAEWVLVSEEVEPGDVLELDPENPGHYRKSRGPCSTLVAGVVSTDPGFVLGSEDLGSANGALTDNSRLATEDSALLALIGIVPVKVTDEGGPIQPGDLLVASSTPGYAMRWAGPGPCPYSLVGKAIEPMHEKQGAILVLLAAP
jgi:hypothetical protein